jgi:hypothetical protein
MILTQLREKTPPLSWHFLAKGMAYDRQAYRFSPACKHYRRDRVVFMI